MPAPRDARPVIAHVVLLAGPSGSGKTHLARAVGLPIMALDDFYRNDSDPDLPRRAAHAVDWEDPASWDGEAARRALGELCRSGSVDVPTYVLGEDRVVGHRVLTLDGSPILVAEGIFAADLVDALRADGLLVDALLIAENRWLGFARRLVRDLREGRKPPWFLVRQGWAKTRAEPAVVARLQALGARRVTKAEARARLTSLAARERHGRAPASPPRPAGAGAA